MPLDKEGNAVEMGSRFVPTAIGRVKETIVLGICINESMSAGNHEVPRLHP